MNRRTFLTTSLAFPYVAKSTVLGANDRVQVGFSYKFDTAAPAPVVARY